MIKSKEKRRDYYRSLLKVASPSRASIELLGSRSCVCVQAAIQFLASNDLNQHNSLLRCLFTPLMTR